MIHIETLSSHVAVADMRRDNKYIAFLCRNFAMSNVMHPTASGNNVDLHKFLYMHINAIVPFKKSMHQI